MQNAPLLEETSVAHGRRPERPSRGPRPCPAWTSKDARALYGVERWGAGFFDVSPDGAVQVRPRGPDGPAIDLPTLAADLERQGIELPALVRFSDILRARTDTLLTAFDRAISRRGYPGRYRPVIPIKVNQQWHVTRAIVEHGRQRGLGLEVGSKPELYIAIGLANQPGDLIICNGFKDRTYVELALGAQKLGRHPLLVMDRIGRLETLMAVSARLGVRPHLGVRVKLATRGAGCWSDSSGGDSKFGLDMSELIATVEALRAADMLDCLELLHFHIGSQITAVDAVARAAREASRIFVELCRAGAPLRYLDCGGGLAVEYGGTVDPATRAMDYAVDQYADALIEQVGRTCAEAGVPHPTVLSESGRALLAHHSLLLFDVLDIARAEQAEPPAVPMGEVPGRPGPAEEARALGAAPISDPLRALRRLEILRAEALARFDRGEADLAERARFEAVANCAERRIHRLTDGRTPTDIAYCNFSLFQSLPDAWGIDQLFPIMPIAHLDRAPTRRAVLADLSCDSHGTVDTFIGDGAAERGVLLHAEVDGRYVLGAFLVGAYQKSLSSLHNLFGATNAVHVALTDDGYALHEVAEGETLADVLGYVHYPRDQVIADLEACAEAAVARGELDPAEARALLRTHRDGLDGYTYLIED